ncbi:HRDC domain-containing protein [Propionicimonas sp.]|uniref:HRDC domain-containing protein n=1 Tax=Propionicimonas sp. TaxID=1955623 RepID=UPI0017D14434|nr:HRDC domain-containing protein [Propionicimonas sp.]MBU3977283.1 HRDC domain-containing protein [Actinomycetota bacterium]MBA3021208.1 ribonuclease D [Propionicimonas sp.]MBU3985793.1 HRDC domain-containing protein [Actinomycetota bacterium]MBU4008578.1 HRDC domain-containing protein [Actinomycetota bacterium]MBU4066272.1 HRDC domain-containing protein [Actinomycetota bacterium]
MAAVTAEETESVPAEKTEAVTYPILAVPADGIPEVIETPEALADARRALAAGTGPLAVDTERAQGYRYTAKAYLLQLRRAGAGTHLIDPTAFEGDQPRADFAEFAAELSDVDWILHAASQDLPCLAEIKFLPTQLFDSELAARLLNLPRVNLSALMETAVGVTLLKEHSAADWSKRPIPQDWLAYAALDVERLTDLREWLIEKLTAAAKLDWALEEFAYLAEHAADPVVPRTDPWRRTSGLHAIHNPAALAVVRELWTTREQIARDLDRSPGRVLADRAITDLATYMETSKKTRLTRSDLRIVRAFGNRLTARYEADWLAALDRAAATPKAELPTRHLSPDGPPQPRSWERRWPSSFERFYRIRPALTELAEEVDLPVENLLSPDHLRRLLWDSPEETDEATIAARLIELGARNWQRRLVVPVIAQNW